MEYRIDREALAEFIARQVELVEAGVDSEAARATSSSCASATRASAATRCAALWLGAGLATHVGLAIFEEPERFITAGEPSPATPAALAA